MRPVHQALKENLLLWLHASYRYRLMALTEDDSRGNGWGAWGGKIKKKKPITPVS